MADIAALILPLFGLIFLGYVTARIVRQPADSMGWLNIFVIYLALPALFFKLLSRTPGEELARADFILASLLSTYSIFAIVHRYPPRDHSGRHNPWTGGGLWQYRLYGTKPCHSGLR